MPRHEQISPEEDLATFYEGPDPGSAGSDLPDAATVRALPTTLSSFDEVPRPVAKVQRPMPVFKEPPPPPTPVNLLLATMLSLVLPGTGQIYVGQKKKGVLYLVLALATCSAGGILNVVAALDAFAAAQRRNNGDHPGEWQFF